MAYFIKIQHEYILLPTKSAILKIKASGKFFQNKATDSWKVNP